MSGILQISSVSLAGEPGELFELLSSKERARAARFYHERDRHRFVIARATLRMLLGKHLSMEPVDVPLDVAPGGKPILGVTPSARALHFNVSHCGDLALIAISESEIGIDVERVRPSADLERVATQFFTPVEAATFQEVAPREKASFFFRTWVRKEAYLKATGQGFAIDPAAFTVDDRFTIHDLPDIGNHVAAVAVLSARSL